jgi:hypothetical protein
MVHIYSGVAFHEVVYTTWALNSYLTTQTLVAAIDSLQNRQVGITDLDMFVLLH